MKYTVAAWAYLIVLVFGIMPLLDRERPSLNDQADWIFIGGFGLALGIAMTWGARDAA
jgi:hypothetical protein